MEKSLVSRSRYAYAALVCLSATGCLDLNPGGSQTQTQAMRVESTTPGRPECREDAVLLILDEDALAPGRDPNRFSERDLGCDRSRVGNRSTLDWFSRHIGHEMVLPSGDVGDEGWFAPTQVRIAWKTAGPDKEDGLRNYVEAGPGLGKPDAHGSAEALLASVPGLAPLRATGLTRLEGRAVCAITVDGEVKMSYNPLAGDIRGKSLGKIAFQVLSVGGPSRRWSNGGQQGYSDHNGGGGSGSGGSERSDDRGRPDDRDHPDDHGRSDAIGTSGARCDKPTPETTCPAGSELPPVRIRILDADAVCNDPLSVFAESPLPTSKCDPIDVQRPSCAVQRLLLDEPWNGIDTALWRPDADAVTGAGQFFAREGSYSAAADWVPKCPVVLDSNSGIRFSNRVQLIGPVANNFVESGALFMVNADGDGSFNNFTFLNVGFTGQPGKVFVELFGSSGGQDFDQFEETSLSSATSLNFGVDLWAFKDSYQVAVGGETIDTVKIASPLSSLSLFEVGVQQNGAGLRGLVDQTTISVQCQSVKEQVTRCRRHTLHRFCSRKGKIYCSPEATEPAASQASTQVVGHIRGRNNLIRMAREKVRHLANPPKGLLMLSRMKEIPDPTQY